MEPRSRLSELSESIAQNVAIIKEYYRVHHLPTPSFEVGTMIDTTIHDDPAVERARVAVMDSSTELHDLLEGPTRQIRPVLNATSLQAIYKYDMPSKVPAEADISYADLAKQCGLETGITRRIVRFAIAHHHVFQEKMEGYVSHSAASKLLSDSPDAMAGLGMMFDETYQSFARTVDALQANPQQTPLCCGWILAHNADTPVWEFNSKNPERRDRTSKAMRQFSRGFGHDTISLIQGYDWGKLAKVKPDALVVDVGGANGHASVLLARKYPGLRFEVQDLTHVIEAAQNDIPTDLKNRVTFKIHDFKQPQPTQADIYLLRQVLHDWPDEECVAILKALIPALKPGARIIVNDIAVPPPGTIAPLAEKHVRAMDMVVMSLCGAKERERSDWEQLFKQAESRYSVVAVHQPESACMATIEIAWTC